MPPDRTTPLLTAAVCALACIVAAVILHRFAGLNSVLALTLCGLSASTLAHWRYYLSRQIMDLERDKKWRDGLERNRQLAFRVKDLEMRIDELTHGLNSKNEERQRTLDAGMRGLESLVSRLEQHTKNSASPLSKTAESATHSAALLEVHEALSTGRIDLHLQPIVTLPQRHVKFYEGFSRLRRADGQIIMPAEFLEAAKQSKLMHVIDTLLLFRCVEIVHKLAKNDRQIGVFCNISASTLEDNTIFPEFLARVGHDPSLADAMIFEMGLAEFVGRSETVRANMSRLSRKGFRFSIDRASSLDLDLASLQAAGVRFVKMDTQALLHALTSGQARPQTGLTRPVKAEDMCLVFRRHGMELIIDKAEDEKSVIELMEYGIQYGQGHVFGPPRPIRESLLVDTTPPEEFMRRAGAA